MTNDPAGYRINRYETLEGLIRKIIEIVGDNPSREGLKETPKRVAKMLLDELLSGYRYNPKDFLKIFEYENEDYFETYADVVIVKDIPIRSICEHHLLPFFGYAHIAYIPTDRVLGLSKFSRIVDVFSRRLQMQERLTNQIADFIMDYIGAKGSLVVIEAIHTCTLIRGVKEELKLITRASRGVFNLNEHLRSEVMSIIMDQKRNFLNVLR